MNWELVEPVLSELLEESKALKKELEGQRQVLEALRVQLAAAQEHLAAQQQAATEREMAAVKRWIREALEEVKSLLPPPPATKTASRCWTLFSSDFQAHNFKVVFETVCKWLGILLGGAGLLYFLFSRWS